MIRIFRHYVPRWSLLMLTLEAAIFALAVQVGVQLRFLGIAVPADDPHIDALAGRTALFVVVMVGSQGLTGRYQRHLDEGLVAEALHLGLSFLFGALGMAGVFYLLPDAFLGRGVLALALVAAFVGVLFSRRVVVRLARSGAMLRRRIVLIGSGPGDAWIRRLVADRPELFVAGRWAMGDDGEGLTDDEIPQVTGSLAEFVDAEHVHGLVVVDADAVASSGAMSELVACKAAGVEVQQVIDFVEQERRLLALDLISPRWWLERVEHPDRLPMHSAGKRGFDLIASLGILVLGSPVMVAVALAIWLSAPRSPVLFRQRRLGRGGAPFELVKFRSMHVDAEADGQARWASEDDARVTRIGRIIRRMHLDELPQLFNVLRGQMSLVGPRPERPEFVPSLREQVPLYGERMRVRPGITGWAQVCFGYGASEQDAAAKLEYDLYYVKNRSLFLDLLVLCLSVEAVVLGRTPSAPGH